jgi:acetoin utilization deacetylase AcuC-like enzyme
MPVFVNDYYSKPDISFETIKKSAKIAEAIVASPRLSRLLDLCDPSDHENSVREAVKEIERYVDLAYLAAIRTGEPSSLASSNGLGWDPSLYDMVVHSTAGILSALREVQSGHVVAASLSSGMHHASPGTGSGFCTVNSLAIAALVAAREGHRVAILDLDAHCGGGTHAYLREYPELATLITHIDVSLSSFDRYIAQGAHSHLEIAHEDGYMDAVRRGLGRLMDVRPDVVFYNAGVDIWPQVSPDTVRERDAAVAEMLISRLDTKCVVVMAGGYGADEDIIPLHVQTLDMFASMRVLVNHEFTAGKPSSCSHCGGKIVPLFYGLPGDESIWDRVARGEIRLGGCCIWRGMPTDVCRSCNREFGGIYDRESS